MAKYSVIGVAIVLALLLRGFVISVYKMPGLTMAPALMAGDYILASQISYKFKPDGVASPGPQNGDLIVYVKNAKAYIRRVLAGPGEMFSMQDGVLTLNSQPCTYGAETKIQTENPQVFVKSQTETCAGQTRSIFQAENVAGGPDNWTLTKLEPGQYLVASDNRTRENNPQVIDVIKFDQIIGKPMYIWMSYSSTQDFISPVKGFRWNRILTKLN